MVAGYDEKVILREFCAEDPKVLARFGIPRLIQVNGKTLFWGYEAPREGIRDAIEAALANL